MTLLRILLPIMLAMLLPAGGAMAQTSGLIRLSDRDDLFGWEAVGRVDIGKGGFCTGVLIAPNQVLTAGHCVYDKQGRAVDAVNIRFRAGLRDGVVIADSGVARYVATKGYDPSAGMTAENIRYDVALLELSEPILTSLAAPFRLHGGGTKGQRVSVVSYGANRDKAPSWQRDCGLNWRAEGIMEFNCNVMFGSSGAPVFARDGNHPRILSLISGGNWDSAEKVAYGMDLPDVVDRLKRDLRAAPSAPSSKGGFRRVEVGTGQRASGAKFAKP
ncbi:MAG: trypsin-like serine protease [Roseovarius sp.]|nr:trypsin-like serine protease [Roseovarius sp.]